MRVLLGLAAPLAALAVPAVPAQAQSSGDPRFAAPPTAFGIVGDRRFHDRRRHRGFPQTVVVGDWGRHGAWAAYNNRTFEADSYNDWWHERPHRSYPRWVRSNQHCDPERMWWGGGVWRCSW